MCGIFGWIGQNFKGSAEAIGTISRAMRHRGPDDEAFLVKENFGLGFRRLSILDLSEAGRQPMSNYNSTCHLVFNGEIYNYRDFIPGLMKDGISFKGHSDSEVLLHRLVHKQEKALDGINGMFAFAFLDENQDSFLLVRDRVGVKPLYYTFCEERLFFASELPSLLKFPVQQNISLLALNRYVHFGHITPPLTIYENIFKLEPGHHLKGKISNPSEVEKVQWWNPEIAVDYTKTEVEWLHSTDELLFDATKIRLAADVPVGLYLSGGIDSSLVAHYASVQSEYKKPKAFTVTFEEAAYSELPVAATVAAEKGLELVPLTVRKDGLKEINAIQANCGEPFSDSSIVNQYYLSKVAALHGTVFLTGDGGDESFVGYNEYLRIALHIGSFKLAGKILHHFPTSLLPINSPLAQRIKKFSAGFEGLGALARGNFRDPVLLELLKKEHQVSSTALEEQAWIIWKTSLNGSYLHSMQRYDYLNYLEPDVLVKVDRATMANSIEARSPFLDYRVVELAMQIPTKYNIGQHGGKNLLRKLAEKHLPAIVHQAPKKGFGLPVPVWLDIAFKKKLLAEIRGQPSTIWNLPFLEKIFNSRNAKRDFSSIVWRVWMYEIWLKNIHENGRP